MYRDADGAARAKSVDDHSPMAVLAQFLESDIQDDPDICQDLIDTITEEDTANEDPLEIIGNSFSMMLVGDVIVFECIADEEDEEVYSLPRDVVLEELKNWLEFLG